MTSIALLTAFLAGLLPALIWLFYWLLEDKLEPEPKLLLFVTFIGGMLAVLLVLPLEQYASTIFTGTALIIIWAALEELCKFGAAYFIALRTKVFDEPIDAVIYMVTVALGFSALENALFIFDPIKNGLVAHSIAIGDLRFMGAMLLHILASAIIGIMMAFTFYKPAPTRRFFTFIGVILAVALHTLFNFFILKSDGSTTFFVFLSVWSGIILLLLLTERIKYLKLHH